MQCADYFLLLVGYGWIGSHSNGGSAGNGYKVGEKEQWCLSTLGCVKALTRQYASEVSLVYKITFLSFVLFHVCGSTSSQCSHRVFIEFHLCHFISSKLQIRLKLVLEWRIWLFQRFTQSVVLHSFFFFFWRVRPLGTW